MDDTQPKSYRKVMSILDISSKNDLDIVVGYLSSILKSESQECKSQKERLSKIITSQNIPRTTQFSDEELCKLGWLWHIANMVIDDATQIYPVLKAVEHRMAPRFYSIIHEYPRTINEAKEMLRRETMHITYSPFEDNNWSRMLPHLRKE
ncbi:P22AR C-terminal domain [Serratia liquefaciens]|uniref:P22AR C-terminal domain-containing protein n=1 Tax=Serratia liquefaciens TaxID=614 RepID=UPI002179B6C0|nr:P22AR C-terminal domain-containing protein [Serratia liquefaciens]CAI1821033.1 P22AR C-terminal domain [Serratia liquefaciens]